MVDAFTRVHFLDSDTDVGPDTVIVCGAVVTWKLPVMAGAGASRSSPSWVTSSAQVPMALMVIVMGEVPDPEHTS